MDKARVKIKQLQGIDKPKKFVVLVIIGLIALALSGLFIAMIALGVKGIDKCPVKPMIPIWLLVAGVSLLIAMWAFVIYVVLTMFIKQELFGKISSVGIAVFLFVAAIFWFAWYIVGSFWIYPVKYRVDLINSNSPDYCQKDSYLMSFWILTIINIALFCLWVLIIIMSIARCCLK